MHNPPPTQRINSCVLHPANGHLLSAVIYLTMVLLVKSSPKLLPSKVIKWNSSFYHGQELMLKPNAVCTMPLRSGCTARSVKSIFSIACQ
ncbi:Uncharacterised protein [Vibrio cholerae]|nr:Uncharacterised protein [Vibrio cholerae]CSC25489.1 Uncharacterised protein [Vibrio cholerae]